MEFVLFSADELHFLPYNADERVQVLQEVYHMGAKLCLVLLTRDVKTASHQLLPEEKMALNAGKHCGSIFLFVQSNVLAHKA